MRWFARVVTQAPQGSTWFGREIATALLINLEGQPPEFPAPPLKGSDVPCIAFTSVQTSFLVRNQEMKYLY